MAPAFTITSAHVALQAAGLSGRSEETVRIIKEAREAVHAMGRLQPRDVLKRAYRYDGFVQVENDDQLRARLADRSGMKTWAYEPQTGTVRAMPQNHMVARLDDCDAATDRVRNGEAIARVPAMIRALRDALAFVEGFEDDDGQDVSGLLIDMRAALGVEGL